MQLLREFPAGFPEAAALVGLRAGMIHLKHLQPRHEIRPPQPKGVHPGPEDHILFHLLRLTAFSRRSSVYLARLKTMAGAAPIRIQHARAVARSGIEAARAGSKS